MLLGLQLLLGLFPVSSSDMDFRLFRELEEKNLDVLSWECLTDSFESELQVRPLRSFDVVKHDTSVAVLLSDSRLDHLLDNLLREVLVVGWVHLGFLLALWGWLLSLGFFVFLLFFKCLSKILLSRLEELCSLVTDREIPLDAEIVQLVKFDDAPLMLLSEELGNTGLACLLRAD